MINDRYPTSNCDECDEVVHVYSKTYIDDIDYLYGRDESISVVHGMCIDFSGGYNQFADFEDEDTSKKFTVLCHDCFLKVARVLPNIFKAQKGYHSQSDVDEASCCEFVWDIDENGRTIFGDGHGGWVEAAGPDDTVIESFPELIL